MSEIIYAKRKLAIAAGATHYFTGKPCKNGHIAARPTKGMTCVECSRAAAKGWHASNRERSRANYRQYRSVNRSHVDQNARNWRSNNPGYGALHTRFYNTAREVAIPSWYEDEEVESVYRMRDQLNDRFNLTGVDRLEVDHIIPVVSKTVCGLHCHANLQLLNASANAAKGNRYETDW